MKHNNFQQYVTLQVIEMIGHKKHLQRESNIILEERVASDDWVDNMALNYEQRYDTNKQKVDDLCDLYGCNSNGCIGYERCPLKYRENEVHSVLRVD